MKKIILILFLFSFVCHSQRQTNKELTRSTTDLDSRISDIEKRFEKYVDLANYLSAENNQLKKELKTLGILLNLRIDSLTTEPTTPNTDVRRPPIRNVNTIGNETYTNPRIRPEYLGSYTERLEGNTVYRISDKDAFGCDCSKLVHNYTKLQTWNSDGTLLKTAGWSSNILNADSFDVNRTVNARTLWSNTEPYETYDAHQNRFYKRNIITNTEVLYHEFKDYDSVSTGYGEGNLSNDDKYLVFIGTKDNNRYILVFNMITKRVEATKPIYNYGIDWAGVSQLGNYVVVVYSSEGTSSYRGSKSYTIDLQNERHLYNGHPHGDLAIDTDGNEVFATRTPISGYALSYADLRTGEVKGMFPTANIKGLYGGHISSRNIDYPGWVLVTEQGHKTDMNRSSFNREVFAVKLDQSGDVMRFAKTDNFIKDYRHDSKGVPNRDLTQVVFVSNKDISTVNNQVYPELYVVVVEQ